MTDFIEDVPAIAISYSMQAGGRNVVLQTGVNRDCKPEKLSELMDKLQGAADRVAAFEAIADEEKEIKRDEEQAWIIKNNLELHDDRLVTAEAALAKASAALNSMPANEGSRMKQRELEAYLTNAVKEAESQRLEASTQRANSVKTRNMHLESAERRGAKIADLRAKFGFKA